MGPYSGRNRCPFPDFRSGHQKEVLVCLPEPKNFLGCTRVSHSLSFHRPWTVSARHIHPILPMADRANNPSTDLGDYQYPLCLYHSHLHRYSLKGNKIDPSVEYLSLAPSLSGVSTFHWIHGHHPFHPRNRPLFP